MTQETVIVVLNKVTAVCMTLSGAALGYLFYKKVMS